MGGAVRGAVRDAVSGAVDGAVSDAVSDAVGGAVGGAVQDAVSDAVGGAVHDAVSGAVRDAVSSAVHDAVRGAVRGAVGGAVRGAVRDAVSGAVDALEIAQAVANVISRSWSYYLGGQFWVGGWWWGPAYTSFFREVAGLELADDLWQRGLAYEATTEAASWWYPHRDFIMVCERPVAIHRELSNQNILRGRGSHRLHNNSGPAVAWADGWGVYASHGVRIPFLQRHIIEAPQTITVAEIEAEKNAEVRRVMIDRYGPARFVVDSGARVVHELPSDHPLKGLRTAKLLRKDVPDDEPIVYVDLLNSTPEPDDSAHVAWAKAEALADAPYESDTEAAWCAGFFDGEGCTYVQPYGDLGGLAISIVQKDRPRIERFAARISGGHWSTDKRKEEGCAFYVLHGEAALRGLDAMWPYLSDDKKAQAIFALKKLCSPDATTKRPHASGGSDHCGRGHSLADAYEPPTKGGRECATCRKERRSGSQPEPFDWWRNPVRWIPGKMRPDDAVRWLKKEPPYSKRYMLRVDPDAYGGEASKNVHAASASTWRNQDGSLAYSNWRDYCPVAES